MYANPGWQHEHGGQLRIWLSAAQSQQLPSCSEQVHLGSQEKQQQLDETLHDNARQTNPHYSTQDSSEQCHPWQCQGSCSIQKPPGVAVLQPSDSTTLGCQNCRPYDAQHMQSQFKALSCNQEESMPAEQQGIVSATQGEDCSANGSEQGVESHEHTQLRHEGSAQCSSDLLSTPSIHTRDTADVRSAAPAPALQQPEASNDGETMQASGRCRYGRTLFAAQFTAFP